jgi:hypothetical protein
MSKEIATYDVGSVAYEDLKARLSVLTDRRGRRPDQVVPFYNEMAVKYNELRKEGYLSLNRPQLQLSNLYKVLRHRGLKRDVDYTAVRITKDAGGLYLPPELRTILVRKISNSKMRVL